jgi:ADP-ribose pyrophosphatase YjhB (NUDIX family)
MVLAREGGHVLLVKRGMEPLKGVWALPSGYVEADESVEAAAVREVLEETCCEVEIEGLEGVFSGAGLGVILVVYRARIVGGLMAAGSDADEVWLADPRDLPAIRVPLDGTELDRWFAGLLDLLITAAGEWHPPASSRVIAELSVEGPQAARRPVRV